MGESRRAVSVTADHVVVDDQRVENSFFHRLHDRGIEVVHPAPRDEVQGGELCLAIPAGRADGKRAGQPGHVRGGEGKEDVAGEMAAGGSGAGQAHWNPSRQRLALSGQQGSVGGDDGDDRACACGRLEAEVDLEPVAVERVVVEQLRPDMPSGNGQFGARAEVGLNEGGDGEGAPAIADQSGRGAIAALVVVAVHAGSTTDRSLCDRAGCRGVERRLDVLGADVTTVEVVEVPVPRFGAHRQQPVPREQRVDAVDPADHPGVAGADRVRIRQHDRQIERSGLVDPCGAGHLAVSVERVPACGAGLTDPGPTARQNRGHAGAHRALADDQRAVAADQGRHADVDAADIGNGVQRSRLAGQGDSQSACPRPAVGGMCRGHPIILLGGLAPSPT